MTSADEAHELKRWSGGKTRDDCCLTCAGSDPSLGASRPIRISTGTADFKKETKESGDALAGALGAAIDRLGQAVRGQGTLLLNRDPAAGV